jgi:DnaJ-class molecular chaperone
MTCEECGGLGEVFIVVAGSTDDPLDYDEYNVACDKCDGTGEAEE